MRLREEITTVVIVERVSNISRQLDVLQLIFTNRYMCSPTNKERTDRQKVAGDIAWIGMKGSGKEWGQMIKTRPSKDEEQT